jgi:hypothetical protein
MGLDRDKKLLQEYYEIFGQKKEHRVSNNLIYRGWAPYGVATSAARWMIQRESINDDITTIEYVDNGDSDNIWDNRASLFGALPWGVSHCTQFDGINDLVNLGNNLNFERTDSFSWAFWVYLDNVTTAQTLFSKRSGSGGTPGIQFNMLSNGRLEANLVNTAGTNLLRKQMTVSVLPQTRYLVGWTYNGGSAASGLLLYLNGIAQTLSTVNDSLSASIATSTDAMFGSFNSGQYFAGKMLEVQRFDKVLSSTEMLELYNGGVYSDPNDLTFAANLTHYWQGGTNDTYPTWNDSEGGIDGTMTNMVSSALTRDIP